METLEERLSRIENRNRVNLFDVEKRLSALEEDKSDNEVKELHGRVHELEDLILLLQLEITKVKDGLTGGVTTGLPNLSDIEHRLKSLEENASRRPVENILAKPQDTSYFNERLNNIENEIDYLKGLPKGTTQDVPEDINKRLYDLEHTIESMKTLEDSLTRLENKLGEVNTSDAPAGPDITEIETRVMSNIENKIQYLEERINASRSKMPSTDLERRLEYVENEAKDINALKKMLDDNNTRIISLEKRLQDINYGTKAPSTSIENLRSEIENQRVIIDDINRNIEIKSTKFLTKYLEEFAKILDQKLESMETPRLEARMKAVEQRVEKLISAMHRLSAAMPVVVE